MNGFPRTQIENLSVSRMIIGTNWFFGWSHTSDARDRLIRSTMTTAKIADVLEVFLDAGVDTMMGMLAFPGQKEAVEEAQQRTGRKIIYITTPGLPTGDDPSSLAEAQRTIELNAGLGAMVCMPHQSTTDVLVDHRTRTIRNMDTYCRLIRGAGMIPGLSTHMPESIVYADESGLDVATYISIYNAAGFLMHVEADWTQRLIMKARHPVITIKPLAAGRLLPLVGLAFVWSTLRDQDMVSVGTMTPDEAKELIEISLSLLEHRQSQVELQSTRSKQQIMQGQSQRMT